MSTSVWAVWLLLSLSSLCFLAAFTPSCASSDVSLAAGMASASVLMASTLSTGSSHADRSRIESMIAAGRDQLTPGKLNAFNFSRPEGVRQFHLYVPSAYTAATAWPLSFYFHGYQGDWMQGVQLNMTWDAEQLGYLLIFGQGTPASSGALAWNAGVCCLFNDSAVVDDVVFARTAVKMVRAVANIDPQRIYTMGWSNGGFMSEKLGCEAADLFAGVAADASAVGILPGGQAGLASCDRSFGRSRLNYLHFHATADDVVLWTGRSTASPYPGTLEDAARWARRLGCDERVHTTYNDGTFSNLQWPSCRDGREVELMTVRNGGHWWWTAAHDNFNTANYSLSFFTRTYAQQHRAVIEPPSPPVSAVSVRTQRAAPGPPAPPRQGAIATGVYRNVFAEAGYAQEDIDARLQAIHQQLWQGDPGTEAIVYPAQDPTVAGSYVTDVANNDVRTEGMSYGMMWAVQLNNQTLFDRIFTWYKVYMQHPAGTPAAGLSAWHCSTDGRSLSAGSASDGETWFVTALIFATRRWGDSSGRYNYSAETDFILSALTSKEDPPCGRNGCQGVINMFGGAVDVDSDPREVRFVPQLGSEFTDPSYHLPAFYEEWAKSRSGASRAAYWKSVAGTSRAFFRNTTHPLTGLAPNYAAFDGSPFGRGSTFSFDAWRTARNIALDLAWYAADYDWQVAFCNRILSFFRSLSTWPAYGSEFTLDGRVTDPGHAPGLVGMNAVCALASNQTVAWDFVDALWKMPTPSGRGRYYDGALYLEAWLHLSGNFRAYWTQAETAVGRLSQPRAEELSVSEKRRSQD